MKIIVVAALCALFCNTVFAAEPVQALSDGAKALDHGPRAQVTPAVKRARIAGQKAAQSK
jgi:hypothetical protein